MKPKLRRICKGALDLLVDENGHVVAEFDLTNEEISLELSEGLLRAIAALYGHTAIKSQRRSFYCVRYFCKFLSCKKRLKVLPLREDILDGFRIWMISTDLSQRTQRQIVNIVKSILLWCHRNIYGLISINTDFELPPRGSSDDSGNRESQRNRLGDKGIRTVLSVCYEAIEKIEERMARGRLLVAGKDLSDEDKLKSEILCRLLEIGKGRIPLNMELLSVEPQIIDKVKAAGGLNTFRNFVTVSLGDALPFYIAVLVQTGGNPESIIAMEIGGLQPHHLRDDLEVLVWEKTRGRKEQVVDFPKNKQWSAPSIIRRLLALNENLRARAVKGDSKKVFLSIGFQQHFSNIPSRQTLHIKLAKFLSKNGLPNFDFVDWRHTNAQAHLRSTSDLKIPQRRLNHSSSSTTSLYVNTIDFSDKDYKALHAFQGELVKRGSEKSVSSKAKKQSDVLQAKTVFGFTCKDPFAGLDMQTPIGSLCLNFTKCSTCTGAIVVLDDLDVIGRIFSAKGALEDAKRRSELEGWVNRFNEIYQRTLNIIDSAILPSVPLKLREKGKILSEKYPISRLE